MDNNQAMALAGRYGFKATPILKGWNISHRASGETIAQVMLDGEIIPFDLYDAQTHLCCSVLRSEIWLDNK